MNSLRSALTKRLLAVGSCLIVVSLVASHLIANRILVRQFDRGLSERSAGLATLLEQVGERVELHFSDEAMPRYSTGDAPEYFQIWVGERSLERSVSLVLAGGEAPADLPYRPRGAPGTELWDLELPDGRPGRAIAETLHVHHYAPDPANGADPGPAIVQVAIAIGRADLDSAIRNLLLSAVGTGVLLLAFMVHSGRRALATSLRPLDELATALASVEAQERSAHDLPLLEAPSELQPVIRRMRSLTTGLEAALERERRTTANIAHELRTPIAELRAITEVALQTPGDASAHPEVIADCRQIARDMQDMVTSLLAIARSRASRAPLATQSIEPLELARGLWTTYGVRARARRLDWRFDGTVAAEEDPVLQLNEEALRAILANLFDNACSHTPEGGSATCRFEWGRQRLSIVVENTIDGLTSADLARFGEPFWRADAARTERSHFGLGLALARECATAAGFELAFRVGGDRLITRLELPRDRAEGRAP